jgi:hypothetical protein
MNRKVYTEMLGFYLDRKTNTMANDVFVRTYLRIEKINKIKNRMKLKSK